MFNQILVCSYEYVVIWHFNKLGYIPIDITADLFVVVQFKVRLINIQP